MKIYKCLSLENHAKCLPCELACKECLSLEYCTKCLSPFVLVSKNAFTKICTKTCKPQIEYQKNQSCLLCSECQFCQIKGIDHCTQCPKCRKKCEFTVSSQVYSVNSSTSFYLFENRDFIIERVPEVSSISKNIQIQRISRSKFHILQTSAVQKQQAVEITISKSTITSTSCRFDEPQINLKFIFLQQDSHLLGLSIREIFTITLSSKLILMFSQIKSQLGYYLIDIMNTNKMVNFLFILNDSTPSFLRDYNDFLRSNNYKRFPEVLQVFLELESNSNYTLFRKMNLVASLSLKENLIAEHDILSLSILLYFVFCVLISMNFFCCFPYFRRVLRCSQYLGKNKYKFQR